MAGHEDDQDFSEHNQLTILRVTKWAHDTARDLTRSHHVIRSFLLQFTIIIQTTYHSLDISEQTEDRRLKMSKRSNRFTVGY